MTTIDRREFLGQAAAGLACTAATMPSAIGSDNADSGSNLHLARFRFDVTPPLGHSLCGGWIQPVVGVDDPLEAIGLVILGAGKPIVLCVVDWTGLLNDAHLRWRAALAEAAGTTSERVTVHCVHQHNAPFACLDAEEIVAAQGDLPHIIDLDFYRKCLDAVRDRVAQAIGRAVPLTAIAHGEAKVVGVASNRRVLGPDGKVISQRGSSSKDPEHHRLPEGVIDPMLKTVAFYHGDRKVAACHYYACHPMSYYGDGRVSSDFCGLARKRRASDQPECTHLYFNGCGGNIGAGKYNDGSQAMREVLTGRIYDGLVAAEAHLEPEPIQAIHWSTHDLLPPPHPRWDEEAILAQIADKSNAVVQRNRPSYLAAWLRRHRRGTPITLSGLHVNDVSMLHLPAESFVEYQLDAQQAGGERFVACAAYGDGGPWYIPTAEAYEQGGYAVSVAWCDPQIDSTLRNGVRALLGDTG